MVLVFCTLFHVGKYFSKFGENILNDFQVTERTQFCDRRTDEHISMAKARCLLTLKGGYNDLELGHGKPGGSICLNKKLFVCNAKIPFMLFSEI